MTAPMTEEMIGDVAQGEVVEAEAGVAETKRKSVKGNAVEQPKSAPAKRERRNTSAKGRVKRDTEADSKYLREAEQAAERGEFVKLSDLLKDADGTEQTEYLYTRYLEQLSQGCVFAIPLKGEELDIGRKVADELIANTPSFQTWRKRVDVDYRIHLLESQKESVGFTEEEAKNYFRDLAKARLEVLKK